MKMPIKVKYVDHGDFFEHMALLKPTPSRLLSPALYYYYITKIPAVI
jgi:hypothetical protein